MKPEKRKAYLELHFAVFLFGFTAILGALIDLSAVVIVWWRVLLTSVSLLFLIRFGKTLRDLPKKRILQFMGIGFLVGFHWLTFFGSVKYANASICLVAFATTSFFTSLLEPLIMKKPIKLYEIGLGLLIIPGMVLVVNYTEISMMFGLFLGILSALLASLFASLNKRLIEHADTMNITFLELSSAWVIVSAILPFYFGRNPDATFFPEGMDWAYLLVLSLVCTTLAYVLALHSLRQLTAFASNLVINMEPVYGIILAWLILRENQELSMGFYLGGSLIILVVLIYPYLKRQVEIKNNEQT
jgi:drug/metabolite transporter (DMT)-like permease